MSERTNKAKAAFQYLMHAYLVEHVGADPAGDYLLDLVGARIAEAAEEPAALPLPAPLPPPTLSAAPGEQPVVKRSRSESQKLAWATRKARAQA